MRAKQKDIKLPVVIEARRKRQNSVGERANLAGAIQRTHGARNVQAQRKPRLVIRQPSLIQRYTDFFDQTDQMRSLALDPLFQGYSGLF